MTIALLAQARTLPSVLFEGEDVIDLTGRDRRLRSRYGVLDEVISIPRAGPSHLA